MRRYFLVQKAREAEIVGILIGTLSASQRDPMLSALKALICNAGRKYYTFVMGKLNSAKLANFLEVGVYVLLGSSEHSLIDSKVSSKEALACVQMRLAAARHACLAPWLLSHSGLLGSSGHPI